MQKKIEIMFDSRYSDEEIEKITQVLRSQFEVEISQQFIIQKALGMPLSVGITLIGISLVAFFVSLGTETGKILVQKFFSRIKRDKDIPSLKLVINQEKEGKSLVITAKNVQEFQIKLKDLTKQVKNNENKKSTKI